MNGERAIYVISVIGGFVIAWLAHRRGTKQDATSAQSSMIASLQEDNRAFRQDYKDFRDEIKELDESLETCMAQKSVIAAERDELRRQLDRMHLKYGES